MKPLEKLKTIRDQAGRPKTVGLSDAALEPFLKSDPLLSQAIDAAVEAAGQIRAEFPDLASDDETEVVCELQSGFVNFYEDAAINPYVPIAAKGPWVITMCGAVLHDSGGYGMLGFGHAPDDILAAMNKPHIMANIMTPSFAHKSFMDALRREVGHSRTEKNPFSHFICMNSGSEAVTVAFRIADINTLEKHNHRPVKSLVFKQAFHGRTDQPARVSDSTLPKYRRYLYSFQNQDDLITIEPNAIDQLEAAFAAADKNGDFIGAMLMEPVMGEGSPGQALDPEFYKRARKLCSQHGTILIIDAIQASLRSHGCLSVVDYPGFQDLDPPDMETYSKALNAGQYPLSVLALREPIAKMYKKGVYGNTMTSNPRALDVATAVLKKVTPALRANIAERGREFVTKLEAMRTEFPGVITQVQGTGLLFSAEIDPDKMQVVGFDCLEEKLRVAGIGVIHGGKNALRFTPHFGITSAEVDLVLNVLRDTLKKAL